MEPIITSKWETDAYKMSMGFLFWKLFQNVEARYQIIDRDHTTYPQFFIENLREQTDSLASLPDHPEVGVYLRQKWPWIPEDYIQWYSHSFHHDPSQVEFHLENGMLVGEIEGPLVTATHQEIALLRNISTLRSIMSKQDPKPGWREEATRTYHEFLKKDVIWSEFGGRRPYSPDVHWGALTAAVPYRQVQKGKGGLIGTSWVYYAYQLGLMPIGTQAHEYTQMLAAYYGYERANKKSLQLWVETYGKRLGYVLPDTFTTEVFLRDFEYGYADLFDGSRQDSGDPYEYVKRMLKHYRDLEIKPEGKSIIHSNSLKRKQDIFALNEYKPGEYLRSFGLGGFVTNNVGYRPYNLVAKIVAIRINGGAWIDTVKISDDRGKEVGKPAEIAKCKDALRIPN